MTHKAIRRTLEVAVLSVLLVLGVRSFVSLGWIVPLVVHGNSMAPHYVEEAIIASRLQTPNRWDPILFHDPAGSNELWIKRIVGLPGERIQLADGDVWINGERLRKDFEDQKRMRIAVDDLSSQVARDAESNWKLKSEFWSSPSASDQAIVLRPKERVTDDLDCNRHQTRLANEVQDLMLEITLTTRAGGKAVIMMPGFSTEIVLGAVTVKSQNDERLYHHILSSNETCVTLSSFDHSILVAIDNQVVFDKAISARRSVESTDPLPQISIQHGDISLRELKLWRDVYYTGPFDNAMPATKPVEVSENGYFVLGDNPAVSLDSRNWEAPASLPKSACVGVVAPSNN